MSEHITEKALQKPSLQKVVLLKTFQDNHLPIDFAHAKFALDGQDVLIEAQNGEVYHLVFGGQLASLDKKAFELDFSDGKTLTAQQVLDIASANIINTDGHLTHEKTQQDITQNHEQTKVYVIDETASAESQSNEDGSNLQSDVNETINNMLSETSQEADNTNHITATNVPVVEAQSQNNSHSETSQNNDPTVSPKLTVSPDLNMYIPQPRYNDANHTVTVGGPDQSLSIFGTKSAISACGIGSVSISSWLDG